MKSLFEHKAYKAFSDKWQKVAEELVLLAGEMRSDAGRSKDLWAKENLHGIEKLANNIAVDIERMVELAGSTSMDDEIEG